MRTHKITLYDAGQALIACQDELFYRGNDLKSAYPEEFNIIHDAAMNIGKAFNDLNSHDFGLKDWTDCPCLRCKKRRSALKEGE